MRRKDRERTREFALDVVDSSDYAVLATVNADGSPYCVPLTIVREGENIYFHCAPEGQKLTNLRACPRVSLCCVSHQRMMQEQLTVQFASAIVEGEAAEVTDPAEKAHALRILCERHAPAFMAAAQMCIGKETAITGIVRVRICAITGKEHE